MRLTDKDLRRLYDHVLDGNHETQIAGFNYPTSQALRNTDPLTYESWFNRWLDGKLEAGIIKEVAGCYYTKE